MRAWKALSAAALCAAMLTGCAATAPATSARAPSTDEPAAQHFDASTLPPSQLKAVGDWINYICSLPPEKRAEAMKGAPKGYVLMTEGGQEGAAKDGPTAAFTCP